MMCPECGKAMNHHADKPDPGDVDPGGAVAEIYACPGCGASAWRIQRGTMVKRQDRDGR